MAKVSIVGLNKAALLAALYNASKAQGMGFMQYDPTPMTQNEAEGLLSRSPRAYFDYLKGRVMKVDLSGDELETFGYNRDVGQDAAEKVIEMLRKTGDVNSREVQEAHRKGTIAAAADLQSQLGTTTTLGVANGVAVMRLGFSDVREHLEPRVREVLRS